MSNAISFPPSARAASSKTKPKPLSSPPRDSVTKDARAPDVVVVDWRTVRDVWWLKGAKSEEDLKVGGLVLDELDLDLDLDIDSELEMDGDESDAHSEGK